VRRLRCLATRANRLAANRLADGIENAASAAFEGG
jgi:hypothetical protein